MLSFLFDNGGRKLWLIVVGVVLAAINEPLGLGISSATIDSILLAVVGGSGTIALEDGLRALFGVKPAPAQQLVQTQAPLDLLADDEKE